MGQASLNFFFFFFLRMGLDKASGLPHEIRSMETDEIAGGVTMGETEIMAARNRGDGEDRSCWR